MRPALTILTIGPKALRMFARALLPQRRALLPALLCAVTMHAGAQSPADEANTGKARAAPCAACHGALGLSQLPNAPHLAGQPAIYLREQLRQYRSGKRQNEVMSIIAKPLTDQAIDELAAWYASIRISVSPP